MRSPFSTADFPADPYPGARPGVSFVELGGLAWVVRPDRVVEDGEPVGLDRWLTGRGAAPANRRVPVLAYGSNACPGKLDWLREVMGLRGPAVVLEADVHGAAAVWSSGFRARDGQRPAILAAMPGVTERHAVWLATAEQLAVLDRVEGRGERHRLARVELAVTLTDGTRYDAVLAYLARPRLRDEGAPPFLNRMPLLVDGRMVRVADVPQEDARALTGRPAPSDGLVATDA